MNGVRVLCPAKVNLTLEILGKRPDGYHELRTVFQAVSLYDELTIRAAEQDSLTVTGLPGVPADDSNLCLRALRLFREQFDIEAPVAITLHKRIPPQAGLGGGSSDAAGMLAGLSALLGEPRQLDELAAKLGSDVAFFLYGGAMVGSGRGEVLEAVTPLRQGALVLAKPEAAVSTAEAYGLVGPEDYSGGEHTAALAACLRGECGLPEVAAKMYNAFTGPVQKRWPAVAAVHARLLSLQARGVLLCGSGAAVLGLSADIGQADAVVGVLQQEGLWAAAAEAVSHGIRVTEL